MAEKVATTVTKKNKSAVHDPTNICLRIHSLDGEDIAILRFTNCSTYFHPLILRYTSLMMKGIRLSALETDVLCPQKWYLRRHNTSFHTSLSDYSQIFSDYLLQWGNTSVSMLTQSVIPIKVIYCVDWVTWDSCSFETGWRPAIHFT